MPNTYGNILNTASNYLGVFPILSIVQVYYNIPVDDGKLEGSKLWHQDGFGYRSLDLFIPLSEIDDGSGPLYVSESHPDYGIFLKFKNATVDKIAWKSGRVPIEQFSKVFNSQQIQKLSGEIGSVMLCDSFQCYHRGGACKNNDRLMLRLSFQTPDATRLKKPLEYLKYYKKENSNFVKNLFFKYLLFYRGIFNDKIKEILVHIYHFFTYVR